MNLPNLEFLSQYKAILASESDDLTRNQLEKFGESHDISITQRLEKSYFSLVSKLDNPPKNMNVLYAHPFILNLLKSSPATRERELRKLVEAFSDFVRTAGTKNTPLHQDVRRNYAENLIALSTDIPTKNPEKWVATLKERLDTKKDQ
jgi:hypothetical protein